MTAGGLSFTRPSVPVAQPDNTTAMGQIISLHGSGSQLGFLAAANNSSQSGTGTLYDTDGTTSTFTVSIGDFWYQPGQSGNPNNTQVAAVSYANYPTGSSGHTVAHPRISVVVTGGTLRPLQHSLVNPLATVLLSGLHASIAFIGCNGVDTRGGVTNINLLVTDATADPAVVSELRAAGCTVQVAA